MTAQNRRRRSRWARALSLGFAGTLAAALAGPASAAVAPPHLIAAVYNASHAEAESYAPNTSVTMEVRRNGILMGTVTGTTDGEGTLPVNPETCWDGHTPEILPGDVISVGTDSMVVQRLVANAQVAAGPTTVTVSGTAHAPNGTTPLVGTVGVRLINPDFQDLGGGGGGGPFRNMPEATIDGAGNWTATATFTPGEHAVAMNPATVVEADFINNLNEITAYEVGVTDPVFPGCPGLAKNDVTSANPPAINIANQGGPLTLSGVYQAGATAVSVTLVDANGAGPSAPPVVTLGAGGVFSAVFPAGSTSALAAGTLTATVVTTLPGPLVVPGTTPFTMVKDLTAPPAPVASPGAGTALTIGQAVTLSPGAGSESVTFRYTKDGVTAPTLATPIGPNPVPMTVSTTLRAIAVDGAGNPSTESSGLYPVVAAGANRISAAAPSALNAAWEDGNANLVVTGTAQGDISTISVRLHDTAGTLRETVNANFGSVGVNGLKPWTATFSHNDVEVIGDGVLTARATFTLAGLQFDTGLGAAGPHLAIPKDTTVPGAPASASPPPGAYPIGTPIAVSIFAATGESNPTILWTIDGSDPVASANTGLVVLPGNAPATVRAVVRDGAGNIGPESTFAYSFIAAGANKVTTTTPSLINAGNVSGSLTVNGTIQDSAGAAVQVRLHDQNPLTPALVATANVGAAVGGSRPWAVTFPSAATLSDGLITVEAVYSDASGSLDGVSATLTKDTQAPAAPTGTPNPGSFASAQSVLLTTNDPSAIIRYTTDVSIPTAITGNVLVGPIQVSTSTLFRAIAIDPAGNVSALANLSYAIQGTPAPPAVPAGGGSAGGGSTPGAGGTTGGGSSSGTPGIAGTPGLFTARIAGFTLPARLSFAAISPKGIRLSGRAPAGSKVLRIRIVRAAPGKAKVVLVRFQPVAKGPFRVTLSAAKLTAIMRPGFTYRVQIAAGSSTKRLGPAVTRSIKVTA